MKSLLRMTLGALAMIAGFGAVTWAAPITNKWTFGNPAQYVVSKTNDIEVADGMARLKLFATSYYQDQINDYLGANGASRQDLVISPGTVISLATNGSAYFAPGYLTSRVFYGGSLNVWEKIFTRAANRTFNNSSGELTTNGLVALYHLNNNYRDEVSGGVGSGSYGSYFNTFAKLGSHSHSSKAWEWGKTANGSLLNGKRAMTLACWVYQLADHVQYSFIVCSAKGDGFKYLGFQYEWLGSNLYFNLYDRFSGPVYMSRLNNNEWYFLVGTYDADAGIAKIYLNGSLVAQRADTHMIEQSYPFEIGGSREAAIADAFTGYIDEVAIWDRALTADEVVRLYMRPTAIKLQVRSGGSADLSGDFTGPDGTNSYYYLENDPLKKIENCFDPLNLFAQYRVLLESDAGKTITPLLETVALYGTKGAQFDSTLGDYIAAVSKTNTAVNPAVSDSAYVGLAKKPNGGYASAGMFTSRIFDSGGAPWTSIAWPGAGELTPQEPGLVGLWNMENSWASDIGDPANTPVKATFTQNAKLGRYSGVFDGTASVSLGGRGIIRAVEFWVNSRGPQGDILDLDGSNTCIVVTNGTISAVGVSPELVNIFVNGKMTSQQLLPGWNHVVVNYETMVSANAVRIGSARGIPFEGLLDGLALYSKTIGSGVVKLHYVRGRQWVAGNIKIQVRESATLPMSGQFRGPGGPLDYFTAPSGSSLLGVPSGRHLQYRAYFEGDGNSTPALDEVILSYGGSPRFFDDSRNAFSQGTFDSKTVWIGDEMRLPDLSHALPASIDGADSIVKALWHMDESAWNGTLNEVADSSTYANHGRAAGDANTSPGGIVGTRCGTFDGAGDYITTKVIALGADNFTLIAWVKTSAANRSALISCYDGAAGAHYYTLEFNGDGTAVDAGRATFIVCDGSPRKMVSSLRTKLNDNHWHQIVGMRQGSYIYIYVDGERQGATFLGSNYGSVHNPNADPKIGRYGSDTTKDFSGLIDEVAVFFTTALSDGALSDGEIADSYAGGFRTRVTGTYEGDVLDATRAALWGTLAWNADAPYGMALSGITNASELAGQEVGLLALWHLNTDWNDSVGTRNLAPDGVAELVAEGRQKVGTGCASFKPNASAVVFNCGTLKTIEFWVRVNDVNANDGILSLNALAAVTIAGGSITVLGFSDARIYVNGRKSAHLARGWNHVAITKSTGVEVTEFKLGVGAGDYMDGRLDEVAIYTIELTESEILQHYLDQLGQTCLAGLWHLDESSGNALDSSGNNNQGVVNGATYGETGKFAKAFGFHGTGDDVSVPDSDTLLDPSFFTFEGWFLPDIAENQIIGDKRSGGAGYALGTDPSGKAFFVVDGVTCMDTLPLRAGKWHHLAGVYDGEKLTLYVDGELRATTGYAGMLTDTVVPLRLGRAQAGGAELKGALDEVALFARALGTEEVLDHYRAGACFLKFQARSSASSPIPGGVPYVGPDGTPNTFFTVQSGSSLLGIIQAERYFQYKAYLGTENYRFTPRLRGVRVDVSSYPTDGPYVYPADGFGIGFLGDLRDYADTLATNNYGSVVYQISGDNGTNWYYWDSTDWEKVTGSGYSLANGVNTINSRIGTFYKEIYDKIGGTFKFKAFLVSAGTNMASLAEVRLGYSPGRLTVISPNGTEVGDLAWLRGYPYTITWSSAGTVSTNNLVIEYSSNSTNGPWNLIATNVNNTGSYSFWTTPNIQNDHMRVRIRDATDPTIWDTSDGDFSLTWRFNITAPNGGEKWYIGYTNNITWQSASLLGLVRIVYTNDISGFYSIITNGMNNVSGGTNVKSWITPRNEALLTQTAKIRIETLGGGGADVSDNFFTMAGIKIVNPISTSAFKSQAPNNIRWVSAGAGTTVRIEFSSNAGTNWNVVAPSVPNGVGTNTYVWFVNVLPTETARLKITSNSDGNAYDLSEVFTVANIEVLAPASGADWQAGRTNSIVWAAGGAGDWVRIYYSTNAGIVWMELTDPLDSTPYPNISGNNTYEWILPNFPTAMAQVKVESVKDPLNLFGVSSNFNIAGVRVVGPAIGDVWEIDKQSLIRWVHQSAGGACTLEFSYDGGLTWVNVVGPGLALTDLTYPFTPRIPTIQGRARITADDPFPFTDMRDSSLNITVAGIKLYNPTNGSVYTIGTTNKIEWLSAGSQDPDGNATLYYTATGSDTNLIAIKSNNQGLPPGNIHDWFMDQNVVPSVSAHVIIKSGAYTGISDPFVLRGIKVTGPAIGAVVDIGGNASIVWKYAGIAEDANADFYLSTDGGVTFSPTPINAALPHPVDALAYSWNVAADIMPSTNAVIKMRVVSSPTTPEDVGLTAVSERFVLRGVKVIVPTATNIWALRNTHQIVWCAAYAGSYANLQYSSDGIAYDSLRPITNNYVITNVVNAYNWPVEPYRTPSTNARIKVTAGSRTGISEPFHMEGIKVLVPSATDYWTLDETNRISWKGVGTTGSYTIQYIKNHSVTNIIVSGWGASFLDWVTPAEAISTDIVIRVIDDGGPYYGDSDQFKIIGEPAIEVVNPAAGDLWKVSQNYTITWLRAGRMENDFLVKFSTDPFLTTTPIANGPATYNPLNNTYSVQWSVPDRLGRTLITVNNNQNTNVFDASSEFRVVGMFTVLSPNGGETNIFARRPTPVRWYSRGTVPAVDLFYSTDPLHPESSWVPIATVPNSGSGIIDTWNTYDWTVADVESATVKFRVQQSGQPGAYDDSDADFAIRYYEILWRVYDSILNTNLDKLSVVDSSGWSQSRLTSPVPHKYPYGFFDTVWSREFFYDSVSFNWKSEPSRTIDMPMIRSQIDPDYRVMANFFYDGATNGFRIHTWLERGGKIFTDPQSCLVQVYDKNGTRVASLPSSTPDANGVFWLIWNVPGALPRGEIYFAKVDIVFSDMTYSSGLTFNLRVPTESEQAQRILNLASNILTSATNTGANLDIFAASQSTFRVGVLAALGNISNTTAAISNMTAAISNMTAGIDTNVGTILTSLIDFSNAALTRLDTLTGTVGVIGGAEPTLLERIASIQTNVSARVAQILTRPTSVKLGSSVTVYYRTRTGNHPNLNVFGAAGTPPALLGPLPMNEESNTGIYGRDVPFTAPTFASGEYTVVCSDLAGSDKMIIQVTAINIDDLAELVGVSNRLAGIDTRLTAMMTMVSNIDGTVGTLTNLSSSITTLADIVSGLTNLTGLSATLDRININITNMQDTLSTTLTRVDTNVIYMRAAWSEILDRIDTNVANMQATMSTILDRIDTNVTNMQVAITGDVARMARNMDVTSVVMSNLTSRLSTNLATSVSNLNASLSEMHDINLRWMTNILSSVSNVQLSADTIRDAVFTNLNLTESIAFITNTLTNIQDRITGSSAGFSAAVERMASNMQVTAVVMSNINFSLATNIMSTVSNISLAVGDIRDVNLSQITNTVMIMSNIQARLMTNIATMASNLYLSAVEMKGVNLSFLTNTLATISNVNMSFVTNIAMTVNSLQMRAVTNVAVTFSNLMLTAVGDMKERLDQVTGGLQTISNAMTVIGTDADAAAKKARSASTAAASAQTAIKDVQSDLKDGKLDDMLAHLKVIRKAIEDAQGNLKQIPESVSTADLLKALQDATSKINKIAEGKGLSPLMEEKDVAASPKFDQNTIAQLNSRLDESKAMLEAVRLLMDESVNKPIVIDWLGPAGP